MAVGALHRLIGGRSSLNPKNKLILYSMIIKPIMLYAAPIWSNTAVTNVTMLQRVQNKCLRMIVNAGPRERNLDIHKRCNMKPIMNEIYDVTKDSAQFRIKNKMPYLLLYK